MNKNRRLFHVEQIIFVLLLVTFAILASCRTHRDKRVQVASDSVQVAKLFHVEHYYDTINQSVTRTIYVFDTVRQTYTDNVKEPKEWAQRQQVRALIVEELTSRAGVSAKSTTAVQDSVQKVVKVDEQTTKERKVDSGVWWWLIAASVVLIATAGCVIYFWGKRFFV
jgi:hypothetical protein